jgi:hypothetical protein
VPLRGVTRTFVVFEDDAVQSRIQRLGLPDSFIEEFLGFDFLLSEELREIEAVEFCVFADSAI